MTVEAQLYLALMFACLVAEVAIFITVAALVTIWNKVAKKQSLDARVAGCVGVVLCACLGVLYFLDMTLLRGTSLSALVKYLAWLVAAPFLPAILVIGAVGTASLLELKRLERERTALPPEN